MNLKPTGIISYKCDWWRFGADKRRAEREEAERKRLNRIETGNRWFVDEIPESRELRPSRPAHGNVIAFFETRDAGMDHLMTLPRGKYRLMAPDGGFNTMLCPPSPTHWASDQIDAWRKRTCPPHRFIEIDWDGMRATGEADERTTHPNPVGIPIFKLKKKDGFKH